MKLQNTRLLRFNYLCHVPLPPALNLPANSGAPTNPQSNFSGDVLGYFSAHLRQLRRVVVQ